MNAYKKLFLSALICFLIIITAFIAANSYFSNNSENKIKQQIETTKKENPERVIKLPKDKSDEPAVIEKKKPSIDPACLPAKFKFKWEVLKDNKLIRDFNREDKISFGAPDNYSDIEGITCFRGNNYRTSASYGNIGLKEGKLEKVWSIKTGYIDEWTGVGWTGQPSIVKWPEDVRKKMNLFPEKKSKMDLKEVIYATLDGKIYFLDLENGGATRSVINVGAPHKGSISIDPRGYPLLYAGQGIDEVGGKRVPIGYRIFSLIDQRQLLFIDGLDHDALRAWGAFDSNGLIDKKTDSLILCGENGILYNIKLNTYFEPVDGKLSINPEIIKYRYYSPKGGTIGMENSIAIYKNLSYFTDNSGTLQCVDLNNLIPVWLRDVTDDSDSTIAIDEDTDSSVSLYTACEVDKQGENGSSFVRKINALTGELLWEKSYKCAYDTKTNGGALASPVIGKNDIKNLVIYNIAKTGKKNGGKLIAFDKQTGKEIWIVNLDCYSWSSPVDVYTKDGKSYLIVCDSGGYVNLIEGISGKIIDRLPLGANIEASPAVYDNMIVVGTRGQQIFGIKIK